jgi:hypothetical protein
MARSRPFNATLGSVYLKSNIGSDICAFEQSTSLFAMNRHPR